MAPLPDINEKITVFFIIEYLILRSLHSSGYLASNSLLFTIMWAYLIFF